MPTVIDALILELNLDPKGLTEGSKKSVEELRRFEDAATKHAGGAKDNYSQLTSALGALQTKLLGFTAFFVGASSMQEFATKILHSTNALGRISQNFALRPRDVYSLGGAAQAVGVSKEGAQSSAAQFANRLYTRDIMGGDGDLAASLAKMEIDKEKFRLPDGTYDVNGMFLHMAGWAQKVGRTVSQPVFDRAGFSQDLQSLLNLGPDKLGASLKRFSEYAPTDAQIASINHLTEAIAGVDEAAKKLGNAMMEKLSPWLVGLFNTLERLFSGKMSAKEILDFLNGGGLSTATIVGGIIGGPLGAAAGAAASHYLFGGGTFPSGFGGGSLSPGRQSRNGSGEPVSTAVNTALSPDARGLLDTIAGSEANGRDPYTLIVGGQHFSGFDDHPRRVGVVTGNGPSTAAGRYQFTKTTWDDASRMFGHLFEKNDRGLVPFTPENQDKMAWLWAQHRYKALTRGRDLFDDLKSPMNHQRILNVLSKEWTSLPGGIEPNSMTGSRGSALQRNIDRESKAPGSMLMTPRPPIPFLNVTPGGQVGKQSNYISNNKRSEIQVGELHLDVPSGDPEEIATRVRELLGQQSGAGQKLAMDYSQFRPSENIEDHRAESSRWGDAFGPREGGPPLGVTPANHYNQASDPDWHYKSHEPRTDLGGHPLPPEPGSVPTMRPDPLNNYGRG